MKQFLGLTRRNLLVYFKDRQAVLFSLLTSIIVFVLYLLFLRQNYEDAILHSAAVLGGIVTKKDISLLSAGILLAALMGSSSITVCYSTLTTLVSDRQHKIDYDICATPTRRWQIILSYFTAAFLSAVVMTWLILTFGLIITRLQGNLYLSAGDIIRLYALTILASLSATALFLPLMLLFKSVSASGAFFGILSAAAGFVIGAYMPISEFSPAVRSFCGIFPGTGLTSLYRTTLMDPLLAHIDRKLGGIDGGGFVRGLKDAFYSRATLFGKELTDAQTVIYVLAVFAVCIAAICVIYPRVYRRK